MNPTFDRESIEKALRRAASVATHGTREEQSGKFLPPPGWKGHLVTAAGAPAEAGLTLPSRHPPASRVFAAQTGGPSGLREQDPVADSAFEIRAADGFRLRRLPWSKLRLARG